jgi:hypothetical protein
MMGIHPDAAARPSMRYNEEAKMVTQRRDT